MPTSCDTDVAVAGMLPLVGAAEPVTSLLSATLTDVLKTGASLTPFRVTLTFCVVTPP